jgi:transaldolase
MFHGSMNAVVGGLSVKLFGDGADVEAILALASDPLIRGFTTNPTLMRQAGVAEYTAFAKELTHEIKDRPICFEVVSDEFAEMERQALRLREYGENVYVKIPITDTTGADATPLMRRLADAGVSINATALLTLDQVRAAAEALEGGPMAIISVFAGRIADAGVDPVPAMTAAKGILSDRPNLELLWASPREVLNVVQADGAGTDIITLTPDLLKKLPVLGRDLDEFSLATVRMFFDDAVAAGYDL